MEELTIFELQGRMTTGELTSVQIVEAYLERIERIDKAGAAINAKSTGCAPSLILVNPGAVAKPWPLGLIA